MNNLNLRKMMEKREISHYPLWHPFSTLARNYFNQMVVDKGEGIYLYDTDGRKYIDACSGLWNVSLGYKNEKLAGYIKKQLEKLPYCSLFEHTNTTSILAANKILQLLPSYMSKIFFTCSGSESIELSIKAMREYWDLKNQNNKKMILSFSKSYHGTYYGSMSVSGILEEELGGYKPLVSHIKLIEAPTDLKSSEENNFLYESIENLIRTQHSQIAGIIIEPILASSGVEIIPIEYLEKINSLCKKHDILLVLDEVALGFYRTGKPFYLYNTNIEADMVCMAKGINGGYLPIGAVAFNDRIVEAYQNQNAFLTHGSTQGGNLLATAAVVAAIEEYQSLKIEENVSFIGNLIIKELKNKLLDHKNVRDIRGVGLIISIDLVSNKDSNVYLTGKQYAFLQQMIAKEGLLVYRSNIGLTLIPMLNTNTEEAEKIVQIISRVLNNFIL